MSSVVPGQIRFNFLCRIIKKIDTVVKMMSKTGDNQTARRKLQVVCDGEI